MKKMTIKEFVKAAEVAKLSPIDYSLKLIKEESNKSNAIVTLIPNKFVTNKLYFEGLTGIPYAMKANFAIEGITTDAASKLLSNFIPANNSTVFDLLTKEKGAIPVIQTNMDELGMGGTGTYSYHGAVPHPFKPEHITGGSSSGSAYVVAKGLVPFALGSDTGDSVRKPAANVGIVGFKPTWGVVSRYGLFDYSPSLDTVGWFTSSVEDSKLLLSVLAVNRSIQDSTNNIFIDGKFENKIKLSSKNRTNKIFYFAEMIDEIKDEEVLADFKKSVTVFEKLGYKVEAVKGLKPVLTAMLPMYYAIAFSESLTSNANLTGINFGSRVEGNDWKDIMAKTRAAGFGYEVKKRFLIGAYAINAGNRISILGKAKQLRQHLINKFNELFKTYDSFIIPALFSKPSLLKNYLEPKANTSFDWKDELLLISNMIGAPSISVPTGKWKDGFDMSLNINAMPYDDVFCLDLASEFEKGLGK